MKITEVIQESESKLKSRVKRAIDKLDDSDVEQIQTLNHVKNVIYDSVLQKTFNESNIKSRCRPVAYEWFKAALERIGVPLEDKVYLVKLMGDERYLIPEETYQKNTNGNLLNHLNNKIRTNSAFKELASPLWKYKIGGQGGMGPGELFMSLFSKNAKEGEGKKGGDVTVGSWKMELKQGGVVPPGDTKNTGLVDKLNKNLLDIAKKENFLDRLDVKSSAGKDNPNSLSSGWIPQFFKTYTELHDESSSKKILTKYLTDLYGSSARTYVESTFDNLGKPGVERVLAPMILDMYKNSHGWDSICFVDENFKFINLVTFENIPKDLNFSLKLKRGGDTNAVADGYMVVGFNNDKKQLSTKNNKKIDNKSTAQTSKKNDGDVKNKKVQPSVPEKTVKQQEKDQIRNSKINEILNLIKSEPNNELSIAIKKTIGMNPTISQLEIVGDIVDDMKSGASIDQIIADRSGPESFYESSKQLMKIKRLLQF